MTAGALPQYQRYRGAIAQTSPWLVIALAGVVLVGWRLDIPLLESGIPGRIPMNPLTAIVFLLAGSALVTLREPATATRLLLVRACGVAIIVLPALCLSRLLLPWDSGVDQLLFPGQVAIPVGGFPSRMAPITGANFVLFGVTLLLLAGSRSREHRIAAALATLTGLVALVVIVDYGYQVGTLSGVAGQVPIALNTAIAFLVLSAGVLSLPSGGVFARIASDRVGGMLIRRLMPVALLLPLVLGWLELWGVKHGLYDPAGGSAGFAIATTLILGGMVWLSARSLERADDARVRAEAELVDLNLTLESRVRARTSDLERVNRDLSEEVDGRRMAQEALRRTTDELRGMVEASPLAICSLSPDDIVLSWNRAAELLFGWQAADVLGKHLPIATGDMRAEADRLTAQVLAGTPITGYETQRCSADGGTIDVSISTAALYDADGKPCGIIAVYADIAERKRLEMQLRQSQKMEAIGRLAGGIAHDFNNILTVIQASAEFLLADLEPGHRSRVDADEIAAAAGRASRLTRQLLVFSRQQVLQLQLLDLNAVVKPLEPMLRRLLESNIDLSVHLAPHVGQVKADSGQLEQVVMNLIVNARDAMPQGGSILIETADVVLDEAYPLTHLSATSGPHVVLSVSDNGVGMDDATQSQIFEPFFTTKRPGEGTGLGLATVYGIVKQLGGHIWVYSELGRGATFKVYLPVVPASEVAAATAEPPHAPAVTPGARILLVEDDAAVRATVKLLLERHAYMVIDVESGADAVTAFDGGLDVVDLVLSDLMMAGMDGLQLRTRLAEMGVKAPVLLMSGYSKGAISRLGNSGDLWPHIEKPFTAGKLVTLIEELLRSPAERRRALAES